VTSASSGSVRPLVRAVLLAVACGSLFWTLWLVLFGGFDVTVAGVRIRSNNPVRVLPIAVLSLTGFFLAGGVIRVSPLVRRARAGGAFLAQRPTWIAAAVAAGSTIVATAGSTRIAGSSDAYGYVSQADLWMHGRLKVPQPWVEQVPWPDRQWTFSPLGYRPIDHDPHFSIVPTYSPGLPLMMSVAKAAGGQCALFLVVPCFCGLAVFTTYAIGRRLGSPPIGLMGAWLVATSPIVLGSMEPLTDVPVMGAWACALYFLLGRSLRAAFASGAFAALAILIRPNLVLLVVPMALWFLIRRLPPGDGFFQRVLAGAAFALGVVPGVAAVAAINAHLYGSAASSGYGRLQDQFAWTHVLPNLRNYLTWFGDMHTPVAYLGFAALAFPSKRLWPGVVDRSVFVVISLFIAVLWGEYCAYLEFDSWGYLRFLLPAWPFLMLGLGAVFSAAGKVRAPASRWAARLAIVALGIWNIRVAVETGAFEQRQAARHEAPIGRLVQAHTDANSVVLALERSGSLRYYAGRTTLRYDLLAPDWLDRAVDWMTARGVHVYAVLDERQAAECKRRFSSQRLAAAFDRPILIYEPAGTALFDLSQPPDPAATPVRITTAFEDRPGCDPPVSLSSPVWR
jgi:Dolichyl-phosphate-mannose-protein mannosyltransferase